MSAGSRWMKRSRPHPDRAPPGGGEVLAASTAPGTTVAENVASPARGRPGTLPGRPRAVSSSPRLDSHVKYTPWNRQRPNEMPITSFVTKPPSLELYASSWFLKVGIM